MANVDHSIEAHQPVVSKRHRNRTWTAECAVGTSRKEPISTVEESLVVRCFDPTKAMCFLREVLRFPHTADFLLVQGFRLQRTDEARVSRCVRIPSRLCLAEALQRWNLLQTPRLSWRDWTVNIQNLHAPQLLPKTLSCVGVCDVNCEKKNKKKKRKLFQVKNAIEVKPFPEKRSQKAKNNSSTFPGRSAQLAPETKTWTLEFASVNE